jgi:hypothetical protein
MSQDFTAYERTLEVLTEILIGKIHGHFSPSFFPLRYQVSAATRTEKSGG